MPIPWRRLLGMLSMPECFFKHLGGCDGQLVKAHLIPKQRIKRETLIGATKTQMAEVVWDPRCWVYMCGGPTGIGGHHGAFDAKQIRLNYVELPTAVKEYAEEYGLEWSLERDYVI
jgi:hypothetical protein